MQPISHTARWRDDIHGKYDAIGVRCPPLAAAEGRALFRSTCRLLVKTHDVATGIAEPSCNLRRVLAHGLHDLASTVYYCLDRLGHAVYQDVEQKPGLGSRRASQHPGAAHLAHSVVKSGAAVSTFSDIPSEHPAVKSRRTGNVARRHLEITDLSICHCGMHRDSPLSLRRRRQALLMLAQHIAHRIAGLQVFGHLWCLRSGM